MNLSHYNYMLFSHCSMIDGVSIESPQSTFQSVAREIFDDGQFNWGRVVMLFYFAYKMAKKVQTITKRNFY